MCVCVFVCAVCAGGCPHECASFRDWCFLTHSHTGADVNAVDNHDCSSTYWSMVKKFKPVEGMRNNKTCVKQF